MKKILIIMFIMLLGVVSAGWNESYKSYAWNDVTYSITASSSNSSDPLNFDDIYQYHKYNPLELNWVTPRIFGGSPYEITENNSYIWFGNGGMSNATDNNTDYQFNSFSISSTVENPILINSTAITRIYTSSLLYVYMPDTSMFKDGDEVVITGSTSHDFVFKITYIAAAYIRGYPPDGFDYQGNDVSPETAMAYVPHSMVFNDNITQWNTDIAQAYFPITSADKMYFAIKSNTTTGNLSHVILRSYYGGGTTGARTMYGAYEDEGLNLSNEWTNFSLNIRDMTLFYKVDYASARTYWARMLKVYFAFENMSLGDEVLIDGVRFVATDRNPQKTGENAYTYQVPLAVTGYFEDRGFSIQTNSLDCSGKKTNYPCISFSATVLGDIQLGDYDYGAYQKEGGVFHLNVFGNEGTGAITLNNVKAQGLTIMGPKNAYGVGNPTGLNTICRDCNFIGILNYMSPSNWTFKGGAWMGGRYFYSTSAPVNIDGLTVYGTSNYQLWTRASNDTFRNLKIIDMTPSKTILYTYDYAFTADQNCGYLINLDISETDNPRYNANSRYTAYSCSPHIGFSVDLKIVNTTGSPIENVNVTITDRNGDVSFTVLTDSDGEISTQDVVILKAYVITNDVLYFDTPTVDWTYYNPYTLTLTKDDYEDYEISFLDTYSRDDAIVKNGMDWRIALESRDWNYSKNLEWSIINSTGTTLMKLSEEGNLAIAGELYEDTNTAPSNILYSIKDLFWLTKTGDLYIVKELMEMIT